MLNVLLPRGSIRSAVYHDDKSSKCRHSSGPSRPTLPALPPAPMKRQQSCAIYCSLLPPLHASDLWVGLCKSQTRFYVLRTTRGRVCAIATGMPRAAWLFLFSAIPSASHSIWRKSIAFAVTVPISADFDSVLLDCLIKKGGGAGYPGNSGARLIQKITVTVRKPAPRAGPEPPYRSSQTSSSRQLL